MRSSSSRNKASCRVISVHRRITSGAGGDGERHALLEERLEEMRKLEQIASAGYPSDAPKTPKKRTTKRSGTRRNEKVRKRKPRRELRSSWN